MLQSTHFVMDYAALIAENIATNAF